MDHRIEQTSVDEVISIGDFIMNGGELPALVIMETLARLEKGFIGNEDSLIDSFSDGLLEYPQYTRPEKSSYGNVPEVLLSGNHEKVRRWKLKESLRITLLKRPDLLQNRLLSKLEVELINEIKDE
jgi:tRNA (guanine37-N1)-methyltransferase